MTLPGLWVADVETGKARQLLGAPEYALNTILDQLCFLDIYVFSFGTFYWYRENSFEDRPSY